MFETSQPYNISLKTYIEVNKGKISYSSDSHLKLLEFIISSMGIKLNSNNVTKISLSENQSYDCLFIFKIMKQNKRQEPKLTHYLSYVDNIDIDKLKFYLPYVKTNSYNTKLVLSIDMLIYGNKYTENYLREHSKFNDVYSHYVNLEKTNYYSMMFNLFEGTVNYIMERNSRIQLSNSSLPILEQFCITDEECPYYKKNTFYKNSRGGCNEGQCEMPIGGENTPWCHGCDSIITPEECCKKHPDYAFPLDQIISI